VSQFAENILPPLKGKRGNAMLGRLRGKSKRSSYTDMRAKVASLIEELQGLEDFSKSRLSVIITTDYKAVIADGRFTPNPLVTVPLNELLLDVSSEIGMPRRHIAIEVAARIVVDRLPPQSNWDTTLLPHLRGR
jgi:hypothetical protein